jgi:hypothetical protein
MSGILPASPAKRRAEEAIREELRRDAMDRLATIERKLDAVLGTGGREAPQPAITDDDVEALAELLAQPDALSGFPRGSIASVVTKLFDDETRTLATSITIWPLQPMSIREALECGLIKGASLKHHVYERMVSELEDYGKRWVRPHEQAAQPAPRARW